MSDKEKVLEIIKLHPQKCHTGATVDDIYLLLRIDEGVIKSCIIELYLDGLVCRKENLFVDEVKFYPLPEPKL